MRKFTAKKELPFADIGECLNFDSQMKKHPQTGEEKLLWILGMRKKTSGVVIDNDELESWVNEGWLEEVKEQMTLSKFVAKEFVHSEGYEIAKIANCLAKEAVKSAIKNNASSPYDDLGLVLGYIERELDKVLR